MQLFLLLSFLLLIQQIISFKFSKPFDVSKTNYLTIFQKSFKLIACQKTSNELDWWKQTIIYQIYTKSFKDSNGDGYGDLQGIIQKLDYIQSLGVNTIWLNPIYSSGGKDGGYDVTSYYEIDPIYGSMNDFDVLVEKLHAKGLI